MAIGWKLVIVVLLAFGFTAAIIVGSERNHFQPVPSIGTPQAVDPVPSFDHIYVIVMENKSAHSIIGDSDAPYMNHLIRQYGLAIDYTAVSHPSQPNYLAFWSGSTQGVRDDRNHLIQGTHLGDQLETSGKNWMIYAENLPLQNKQGQPICFKGATASGGPDGQGTYARKHNPAVSFLDINNDTSRCMNHISDFSHFDPGAANVELIVPNLCHDMHDCSVSQGDSWLKDWLPSHILNTATWENSNSAIFITWDEGSGNHGGGGDVPMIVISKQTPAGFTSHTPHNHYSLLRTIEEANGLPCLHNACSANTLGEFFKTGG